MRNVTRALDVARFEPGDPPEIVRSTLSCSWCLNAAEHLTLSEDDLRVSGLYECTNCGLETVILLTWRQVAVLAGDDMLEVLDEDGD